MPITLEGQAAQIDALLTNPSIAILAHLAKNPIPLDVEGQTIDDMVECDFPGYAPQPIEEATEVFINETNYAEVICGIVTFTAGAIVAPQSAYALYVTIQNGAGPVKLWAVENFPSPVVFENEGQILEREARLLSANLAT